MCDLWSRVRLLCLLVAVSACSESSTSECGNQLCPTSKVCHVPSESCVDPRQLVVCVGKEDGDGCRFPGSVNGLCEAEICSDSVCGNRSIDFGEVCDDGNTQGLDGCSADCRSNETCGNSIVDSPREQCDDGNSVDGDGCQSTCQLARCGDSVTDSNEACDDGNLESGDGCNQLCTSDETCGNGFADFDQGEQCDDGGFLNQDGCTSVCTAELPLWTESALQVQPGRIGSKMVFRGSTGRVTLFGGTGPIGEPQLGTLEFRSDQWARLPPGLEPPPRSAHLLIYDASRRVVVAFGGSRPVQNSPGMPPPPQPPLGDTWELDDDGWQQIATATAPGPRRSVKGAYDATREEIVVFGGRAGQGNALGDTWIYNGTWTQVVTAGPPARSSHLMAYDVARDRTVLFGGVDSDSNELTDTWEWDGAAWNEVASAVTIPTARGEMAYHATAGIVAFSNIGSVSNATWLFDGVDWTEVLGDGPPPRFGSTLAFDPTRDALLMAGGGPGNDFKDVWEFDGSAWTEVVQVLAPDDREFALIAHDSFRRQTLFFGGAQNGGAPVGFDDLWQWDGRQWKEIDDIGTPPPGARFSALVFDSGRGCFLAVRPNDDDMEVHQLCGRVWTPLVTTNPPPARSQSTIAYDSVRDRLVLFGGGNLGAFEGDTWELNGSDWSQVSASIAPSPRILAMATFDPFLEVFVLFGGRNQVGVQSDTWIFDGTDWTQIPTDNQPSPRFGSGMVYNAASSSVMIHGGDPGPIADTWEFDGTTWSPVVEPQRPEPRPFPGIGYDATRKRVVFAAARQPFDTWEFAYSSTTVDERCVGGQDEDGDSLVDCQDPDCNGGSCGPGALFCEDSVCVCANDVETHCGDEFDGDCDGLIDCADPDCAASADCSAESNCADGSDNDNDGRLDCRDLGCVGVGICEAFEVSCEDGQDNDGDGRVDCQDTDCYLLPCPEVLP